MIRYPVLIIDGHNCLWRSFFINASETLYKKEVIYNGGIEQFISRLNSLIDRFCYRDDFEAYLLFDNPTSTLSLREEISQGEYKSHRLNKKYSEEINRTVRILIEILKNYSDRFHIVNCEKTEADDLTQPLIQYLDLEKNNKRAVCISADLDWARNISKNVIWYNYYNTYDIEDFTNEYGYSPEHNAIKIYKAFKGDKSDRIPIGVKYLPEEIVIDIIKNYSSLNDLFDNLWKYDEKIKHKIQEAEIRLRKNYALVDFIDIDCNIVDCIYKCKVQKGILKQLYAALNIPLESWMQSVRENRNNFLTQKKIKVHAK